MGFFDKKETKKEVHERVVVEYRNHPRDMFGIDVLGFHIPIWKKERR